MMMLLSGSYGRRVAALFLGLSFVGCISTWGQSPFPPKLPTPKPINPAQLRFTDITEKLGIHFRHQPGLTSQKYIIESFGGGVAIFDFDNDGRPDIFFANGAALKDPAGPSDRPEKTDPTFWNRLYHQEKDGTFTDVTAKSGLAGEGYSFAAAVGDYNNDGFDDLYVTGFGHNHLYRNNGDGTFTDVTESAGVGSSGLSSGAAWVDYDNDGLLDLIVLRYVQWDFSTPTRCGTPERREFCGPEKYPPTTLTLYHNDGGGHFSDVTAKAGLPDLKIKGLGVDIGDYDQDGWTDIFIANDNWPQMLLRNRGDGTFEERGLLAGISVDEHGHTFSGMGIDLADYDNDGWLDLLIDDLSFQHYALYRNNRDGTFTYSSSSTGLAQITAKMAGWGARLADFDNDGLKDIFVAQGHVNDGIDAVIPSIHYRQSPLIVLNTGSGFQDVSSRAGPVFQQQWDARGLAIGDLHNSGRLDVVVSVNDGPAHVLRSDLSLPRHWLSLKLEGSKSNRDAIGATVTVTTADGTRQFATVKTSASYFSSSDARLHFGLNDQATVARIEVRWPSKIVQTFANIPADRMLVICETSDPSFQPLDRKLDVRESPCTAWRAGNR
jgi:hypothetical protein